MRINNESDILNPEVRKQIIESILGDENVKRKNEAYKRYELYKDQTKRYVREILLKQFDQSTVNEMSYVMSNISIVRKVVDKLAKVYAYGTERSIDGNAEATKQIEEFAKAVQMDTQMKKNNRYLKLQKNTMVYVKPCPVEEMDGSVKYKIKLEVLNPYLYDVIEDSYDREKPMVVILSNYKKNNNTMKYTTGDASIVDRGVNKRAGEPQGDGVDQPIADTPIDEQLNEAGTFVWWSKRFHFTTDVKGQIISAPGEITNPILKLPFASFNIDQDGNYWAQGGDDLIDAGILVNAMVTNVQHVGVVQGYGQFWMRGKKVPSNITVGPTKCIKLEYEEGDPVPEIGFASSSPQLNELKALIEMYMALTLTTNNLSTKGVSTSLQGGQDFPSGIAMVLDAAESMEDVVDQRQIFLDKEPEIWSIASSWQAVYGQKKLLAKPFDEIKLPPDPVVTTKFVDKPVIMSEAEKLANIKVRKELGINTMIDLVKMDNPGITNEQAQAKLLEITKDKMLRAAQAVSNATNTPGKLNENNQSPGNGDANVQ